MKSYFQHLLTVDFSFFFSVFHTPVLFSSRIIQNFFKDPWNVFDFITVVGSIIDALVMELGVSVDTILNSYIEQQFIDLNLKILKS